MKSSPGGGAALGYGRCLDHFRRGARQARRDPKLPFADYGSYRLFPTEKFAGFKPPKKSIPRSIGHHAEWIKACKEKGTPTTCNFDYSGALTEAVLLGNVAYRTGESLEWDAKNLKATNCPAADKYIRKEYRPGWEVS